MKQKLHLWNVFHYVLGTKYFEELGYFDLYKGVLLADLEQRHIFNAKTKTRNQHNYKSITAAEAIAKAGTEGVRDRFTDARWAQFKADMDSIMVQREDDFWKGPISDRGFNPSPAWILVQKPLLNMVNIQKSQNLLILCYSQLIFYILTIFFVWWAFGTRTTVLFFIWFFIYIGNGSRVIGGYFTYDWFFLTVIAVCLYKRGHAIVAAPLLAYAALMRGFPLMLALYPAVQWTLSILHLKRPKKLHIQFLFSLALFSALIFGLSSISSNGVSNWTNWYDKISMHAGFQPVSAARIGLAHLVVNSTSKHLKGSQRLGRLETYKGIYRAIQALFLMLILVAMRKRDEHNGFILGLFAVFSLTLLSRYYFAFGSLFVTWSIPDMSQKVYNISTGYLLGLLALVQVLYLTVLSLRNAYFLLNFGIAVYILFILMTFILTDLARDLHKYKENRQGASLTISEEKPK